VTDFQQITFDRGFRTLFEDGVYLLMASEIESDNDTSNSLARGSIACTMMLPEVCANICIESLELERSVFSEIDKLAPIAKFDFYLRTSFRNKKIPSGVKAIQKVQELKRLRDTYVHPKKQAVFWTEAGNGDSHGTSERTQFLDMSKNPSMWNGIDAENAMRGAHEFLRFFFHDLCNYPKNKVTNLLFSEEPELLKNDPSVYYYKNKFHNALKKWKVDISYFRIGLL